MKKITTIIVILITSLTISAQDKEVFVVDYFKSAGNVPSSVVTGIYESVSNGFVNNGRFTVMDKNKVTSVAKEQAKLKDGASLNLENAKKQQELKQLGADYLITGVITNYGPSTKKNVPVKVVGGGTTLRDEYNVDIQFALTAISITDGSIKGKKTLSVSAMSTTSIEDAKANAIKDAIYKTDVFIQEFFPFEATIDEVVSEKKGKAKEVLISAGKAMGVNKGDTFEVYEVTMLKGKKRRKSIGKITVKSVDDDNFSTCKVSKGGDIILSKYNDGANITCQSLKDSKGKQLIKGFGL